MPFTPLELEEWHSRYELNVTHNLDVSGVPPIAVGDLLTDADQVDRLSSLILDYPPATGTRRLRELIAAWAQTSWDRVLVTVGAAEAVEIAVSVTTAPGDRVLVFEPGYRQVRGAAANLGAAIVAARLDPRDWRIDFDALNAVAAGRRIAVVAVTNPGNPSGTVLTSAEMDGIVAFAAEHDAWLVADEAFRGSERTSADGVSATFAGRYDKAVVVGSLSKAFGLPGLRLGWLIAPPELLERATRRHEYAVIAASALSVHLAELALDPPTRDRLLRRGRDAIIEGYERMRRWIDGTDGLLTVVEPQATAAAFVHYDFDVPSIDVANMLRIRAGTLVGVGAHFGGPGHLRIGFAVPQPVFDAGSERIMEVLRQLRG